MYANFQDPAMEYFYVDVDGDAYPTLEDLREAMRDTNASYTRYVRDDLCIMKKEGRTFIEASPLLGGVYTDKNGDIWTKTPAAKGVTAND